MHGIRRSAMRRTRPYTSDFKSIDPFPSFVILIDTAATAHFPFVASTTATADPLSARWGD